MTLVLFVLFTLFVQIQVEIIVIIQVENKIIPQLIRRFNVRVMYQLILMSYDVNIRSNM